MMMMLISSFEFLKYLLNVKLSNDKHGSSLHEMIIFI